MFSLANATFRQARFAQRIPPKNVSLQCGHAEQGNTSIVRNVPLRDFVRAMGEGWGVDDGAWWLDACPRPYIAESSELTEFETGGYDGGAELRAQTERILDRITRSPTNPDGTIQFWWVGPAGVRTGLHRDPDQLNILHQLHGVKDVWVYKPEDTARLYPNTGKYDYGAVLSHVDVFDDPEAIKQRFPLFDEALPLHVTLHPGDALFVPGGWYHYAVSRTPSVSLSGRAFTICEFVSMLPMVVEALLHVMSPRLLHSKCTCHEPMKGDT